MIKTCTGCKSLVIITGCKSLLALGGEKHPTLGPESQGSPYKYISNFILAVLKCKSKMDRYLISHLVM